jgi:HEAT repeat protein
MRPLIPVLIPLFAGALAAQPPIPTRPTVEPPPARVAIPRPITEERFIHGAHELQALAEQAALRSADIIDRHEMLTAWQSELLGDHARWFSAQALTDVNMARVQMTEAVVQARDARMVAGETIFRSEHPTVWSSLSGAPGTAFATTPRNSWLPQDVADSLYRAATQLLNRQEYRQAATLFRSLPERFPRSGYHADALYWEAFSLYRLGETREALRALDTLQARHSRHSRQGDASALSTRVLGQLATQGDAAASARLARAAREGSVSCDPQAMAVRTEALNALSRMNAEGMGPTLENVLNRRDNCSTALRQSALLLLSRQPDAVKEPILTNLARTEPSVPVRRDAINWLGQLPGERPVATLEAILRNPADSLFHSAVLRALAVNETPRAHQLVRGLIEQRDAPLRLRYDAIASLERNSSSVENAAYLRSVYSRLDSVGLRNRAIDAVAKMKGEENQQWIAAIVRNTNEPMSSRKKAISHVTRSTTPIADVVALYDAIPEYDLKLSVINALGSRREPEATDKLILIVKNNASDPQLRRVAIGALSRKNDPRTQALLMEILKS